MAIHAVDVGDREEANEIRAAVKRLGVGSAVYLDYGYRAARAFRTGVYPTFALVDRQGMVRYRHAGRLGWHGERKIQQEIELLLAEAPAARAGRQASPP